MPQFATNSSSTRSWSAASWRTLALLGMAALLTLACNDSLRQERIDSLGEEAANFEASDIHRPGQPCVWCHDSHAEGEPEFSIAGTLFVAPPDVAPYLVGGYVVRLLDSEGTRIDVTSNRCGNFFVTKEQYDPAYPVRAEVLFPDPDDGGKLLANQLMSSRIARDGSCGGCHKHPASPFSPGVAYVSPPGELPTPPTPSDCPPPSFAPQL
jgi:hypothetical protein